MLVARPTEAARPSVPVASTSKSQGKKNKDGFVILKGVLTPVDALPRSGGRVKKLPCPFDGCDKLYTRQSRLDEHVRSHTGEKPFVCGECRASFGRDSHLKAHMRTHMDESDKKCGCTECDKRFWTTQHLKKHVEVVHRGKTYDCADCDAKFRKHHQLRTHVAEAHSPPGTLPFKCTYDDCDKSFSQKVHLQAHQRTHDPSRYACYHPDCKEKPIEQRQYGTWTALQKHGKEAHPPTCPYPECQGKTFANRKNLKNHVASHARADNNDEGTVLMSASPLKRRKRSRKGRAGGRKSETDETTSAFEGSTTEQDETEFEVENRGGPANKRPRRAVVLQSAQKYRCPFPTLFATIGVDSEGSTGEEGGQVEGEACMATFDALDELEPHMMWIHEKNVDRSLLEHWFASR